MSTPTTTEPSATEAVQEIRRLALSLTERFQTDDDINPEAIVTQHQLGSLVLVAQFAEVKKPAEFAAEYLPAYRAAVAALSAAKEDRLPVYDDLSTVKRVRKEAMRLLESQTLARLVIIKAETACGKSTAMDAVESRYNAMSAQTIVFRIEGSAAWNDKPNNMLGAMLEVLGVEPGGADAAKRMAKLVKAIKGRGVKTIIQLDETHDLKVRCLRSLKTLLNLCEVRVMIAAHPRLFRTIEAEYADDLSQLTGNRLLASIELPAPQEADVSLLVQRQLPSLTKADGAKVAKDLTRHALGNGNLAFVRETILRARALHNKTGTALTAADLDTCMREELSARGKGRTTSH